jgi:hypothetical protein
MIFSISISDNISFSWNVKLILSFLPPKYLRRNLLSRFEVMIPIVNNIVRNLKNWFQVGFLRTPFSFLEMRVLPEINNVVSLAYFVCSDLAVFLKIF